VDFTLYILKNETPKLLLWCPEQSVITLKVIESLINHLIFEGIILIIQVDLCNFL
jgi:hypothetical protein